MAQPYLGACRDLAREFGVYLACGTAPLPHFRPSGGRLVPDGGEVYNHAVILAPDGSLVGTADKVHLTTPEGPTGLDLSPGRLEDLRVYPTPVGDLAVATSLDAFRDDVIDRISRGGATVMLQPDANGSPWTDEEHEPPTGRDQPVAWLDSAWRAVRASPTLRYAVNPMVVGNLFEVAFDGQSAITAPDEEAPEPRGYVMTTPRAGFLRLVPWVEEGSDLDRLREAGRELAPRSGHPRENAYRTAVISADLHLPPQDRPPPAPRPHEEALSAYLGGEVTFEPSPARRVLRLAWPLVGAGLAAWGAGKLRRRRARGLLGLVGLLIVILAGL
ncbi:nitrilase-related carbon-nitrogen hydrolase [Deinococcus pimensis]|uniref:nitrilase-related carbon-nitrogen hydrolase n=1 Tax=Deinococcus pimensis TaxID=309888 RepID=UPI001FE131BF|nr:nitrilase-related carbon-nitrogen hydrolase [Deinococcus pimensis]